MPAAQPAQRQQAASSAQQPSPTPGQVLLALSPALSPVLALPALYALFGVAGEGVEALRGRMAVRDAIEVISTLPPQRLEGLGVAQQRMVRVNAIRQAAYLINSVARLRAALDEAAARGMPLEEAESDAVATERTYFAAHYKAGANRMSAANAIDGLSWQYGDLLGWYAKDDPRTTAECRAANRKNFSVSNPPTIGYPGEVHVNCRCKPGKPWRNAPMLRSAA